MCSSVDVDLDELDGRFTDAVWDDHPDLSTDERVALFAAQDAEWPPTGLVEDTAAGPQLAALLSTVSVGGLPGDVLVEVAAGAQRLASWAAAQEAAATAELTARCSTYRGVGARWDEVSAETLAAAELGAALALSPMAARMRVELAATLRRLPLTRVALATGRIDVTRARAVAEAVAGLDSDAAAAVEARVLPGAGEQTAPMLRAALRRAVISADPAAAEARRESKALDRGVWREVLPDGMGQLAWVGPVEQVEASWTWLTATARQLKAGDVRAGAQVRTLDQCRSDVLADLGARGLALQDLPRQHARRPGIDVVVALSTLLGVDDEPGELLGAGPVTAETARRIAAEGTWRRLLTDPRTGRLDEMSAGTYEPPQVMRDLVIARDRTCRGLGCRMPADRCDRSRRSPTPRSRSPPTAGWTSRCPPGVGTAGQPSRSSTTPDSSTTPAASAVHRRVCCHPRTPALRTIHRSESRHQAA